MSGEDSQNVGAVSPEGCADMNNIVIGVIDKKTKMIETFKPSDRSWNALHNISEEICGKSWFCAIAVDQVVFVLARDRSNFKFNLSEPDEDWISLPERSKSGRVQVVEVCGEIYAFHDNDITSSTIEILETDHGRWRLAQKPKPCFDEAVTVARGCIYVFGGQDESWLERATKFDPSTKSWKNLPDMSTARIQAAATALDDKIYVLGSADGQVDLETVECFDISTQNWTTLKSMNSPHRYFSAFAFDGRVYAVERDCGSFAIEEYDPAADTWKDVVIIYDMDIPEKGYICPPCIGCCTFSLNCPCPSSSFLQ